MARRYTRDNRGRFSTVGATARGGRLKTAAGNKRATQTKGIGGGKPAGTIGKPKGAKPQASAKPAAAPKGSYANTKAEQAKGRAAVMAKAKGSLNKQLRDVNAKIKEAGPSAGAYRLEKLKIQGRLQEARGNLSQAKAAARGDTASANVPMRGARGKALNAEISRNVAQQKATARAADKARNRQYKSDQSRAKKLRDVHGDALAKGYASRNPGRSAAEVKRRIGGMEPSAQIKLFKQYVKENRGTAAKPAGAAASRRKPIGQISEAKAGRIVARMDANRPGRRLAAGSARKNANMIKTHEKATAFALAAGARARKKGQSLSVNESLQRAVKNASKTRAAKPAAKKATGEITPEKVSRVTGRVNAVTANASSKQGIKRLNATEVGVRAKAFLSRKAGGMSGMVGKSFSEQQAVVAAGLKKPTRYSTQKPNRNKPRAYNDLGQANIRRKNQAAANIERDAAPTGGRNGNGLALDTARSIRANSQRLTNIAAASAPTAKALKTRDMGSKAPDTARSRNNRLRTTNRRVKYFQAETDSLKYKKAVSDRADALAARPAGTGSKVVFRGKNKAASRQNIRANDLTSRVRYDLQNARPGSFKASAGGGRVGIRRSDTGNRQPSLLGGPAKKLYSTKRVSVKRASGKRRYGSR